MRQLYARLSRNRVVRRLGTVAGFTMLSRATGALRDLAIAAVLGAGPLADAFFVALRLPNHFRSIFAEGAFNAAFVPTYASTLETEGRGPAMVFAGRVLTAMVILQAIVLAVAEVWTAPFLEIVAPGFSRDPAVAALTVTLTRITFPFLASVTIITVLGAVLNAHGRFAASSAAPVIFNLAIVAALPFASLLPSPAMAPALGVVISAVAQIVMIQWALSRAGLTFPFRLPVLDPEVRTFLRRVGPAIIGSGAAQIAVFADTILAAGLPYGALSALNYADRLYQLPIGVIGVAMGTVLLPELTRMVASGDHEGANWAEQRALAWSLAMTFPFAVAFLVFPDEIVALVYQRGAFHLEDVPRSAATLQAYSIGLIAVVLIRSVVAGFNARGDTRTPMLVALVVLTLNVGLKILLTDVIDVAGLAAATSAGAWANLGILALVAWHRRQTELRIERLEE